MGSRTAKITGLVLVGGIGSLVALMARGRLTLDTGWGRTVTPVGPITMRIAAPRELVFDYLASPYLGRASREARRHLDVWERGSDMVVAAHVSRLRGYTAETVEAVCFERPHLVVFRHLRGPVPHARESFALTDDDGATVLEYRGEIGLDFWALGQLVARGWVVPTWEGVVRESLVATKLGAEQLSAARARRARSGQGRELR